MNSLVDAGNEDAEAAAARKRLQAVLDQLKMKSVIGSCRTQRGEEADCDERTTAVNPPARRGNGTATDRRAGNEDDGGIELTRSASKNYRCRPSTPAAGGTGLRRKDDGGLTPCPGHRMKKFPVVAPIIPVLRGRRNRTPATGWGSTPTDCFIARRTMARAF